MNKRLKSLILDSSIIAKWFFPEDDTEIALEIKNKFLHKEIELLVPLLLYYEVSNLLKSAVKSSRATLEEVTKLFTAFLKLNFEVYSSRDLMSEALKKAVEYDISSYDAAYIVLSEQQEVPFITADQKLINKVNSKFMVKLKDYTN